ncbi:MAG: hypothetical protein JNL60_15240 [Bacteroidia bacterium]|nr:hypothetical protein [Bacteroidia bacterium]
MNPEQVNYSTLKIFFVALFVSFAGLTFGQNLKEKIGSATWYSKQVLGDSMLVLSKDNKTGANLELKLSGTGKCIVKTNGKTKADSTFQYCFDKKNFSVNYKLKDSVTMYRYEFLKSDAANLTLRMNYSFRYKYKKGNDTILMPELTFSRGKDIKTIMQGEDITLFVQKKGRLHDSIELAVWGQFIGFIKDTIIIDSDQFVEHNFYKKYPDSLHYYSPLLIDTIIRMKIPVKYIVGIYKEREPFGMYMTRITVGGMALGLGFMVASLTSGKEIEVGSTFATISTAAFLTVPVSFAIGTIFSKQKFRFSGGDDPAKLWKIERHMPRPKVKIYKKGKRII